MRNMHVLDMLTKMIDEAKWENNDKLAKALSDIQLEMVRELGVEWSRGFSVGNGLALKALESKRLKVTEGHIS